MVKLILLMPLVAVVLSGCGSSAPTSVDVVESAPASKPVVPKASARREAVLSARLVGRKVADPNPQTTQLRLNIDGYTPAAPRLPGIDKDDK